MLTSGSPGDLPVDHPGFADEHYRARRTEIAGLARRHRPGEPLPTVAYLPAEHEIWRRVSAELAPLHRERACSAARVGAERLALPADRLPQLGEVSARLRQLTGFEVQPVPGLVPARDFYGSLADRRFMSTQYVRHPSVPLYTPEPDVIHEVIGHLNLLAHPTFAHLHRLAGQASRRALGDDAHEFFSRVFWFTLEFGVVWERGRLQAYGAGLLSSFGELQAFRQAEIRPLDLAAMGRQDYDITTYQPVLFAAESIDALVDRLEPFFATFDDESYARLTAAAA